MRRKQPKLTQGAEICAKDTLGQTPLHYAAWKNATETAQLLLTQGADVNEKDKSGRHYTRRLVQCD